MREMGPRRVQVDLSEYYSNYKKYSLVFINQPSIKIIQDLKNHICELFDLINDFEIFICDAHVPSLESVHVIEDEDIIQIRKVTNQPDCSNDVDGRKMKNKVNSHEEKSCEVVPQKQQTKKGKKRMKDGGNRDEMFPVEHTEQVEAFSSELKKKRKKSSHEHKDQTSSSSMDVWVESVEAKSCQGLASTMGGKGKQKLEDKLRAEISGNMMEMSTPQNEDCNFEVKQVDVCTEAEEMKDCSSVVKTVFPVDEQSSMTTTEENFNKATANIESILSSEERLLKSTPVHQNTESSVWCGNLDSDTKLELTKRKRKRPRRRKHKAGENMAIGSTKVDHPKQSRAFPQSKKLYVRKVGDDNGSNFHLRFSDEEEIEIENKQDQIMMRVDGGMELEILDEKIISNDPSSVNGHCKLITRKVAEVVDKVKAIVKNEGDYAKEMEVEGNVVEELDQNSSLKEKNSEESHLEIPANMKGNVVIGVNCDLQGKCSDPVADVASNVCNGKEVSLKEVVFSKPDRGFNGSHLCSRSNRRKNIIIAKGVGSTLTHLMGGPIKSTGTVDNTPERKPIVSISPPVTLPKSAASEQQISKKDRKYRGFPVLEKFPCKGDILAFKILKLNEKYEPSVSDYVEGKVTEFDRGNNLVNVRILAGGHVLRRTAGKFDLEDDEATTKMNDDSEVSMELQWNEFIEPRIIFP